LLEILFDNNFLALGIDLQTELISDAKDNKTLLLYTVKTDITHPITDTYQVAGNGSI
jgi:hypothetical protein